MKLALRIGGVGAAVAILALLVSRLGAANIAAQLAEAGPGFLWMLALHAVALILGAFPWYVLLPRTRRPTVGATITSRFIASGASALPVVGIAGDLTRLFWLAKDDRAPGLAALVVDRLLFGVGAIALLGAGLLGLSHLPAVPAPFAHGAMIGLGVLVGIVAAGVILARRGGIGARIERLVTRIRHAGPLDAHVGADADAELRSMLRLGSPALHRALLLHLVARAALGAEIVVGFWLLGVPLHWDQALVFAALPIMLSVAGLLVPSQLGVHEGAQALVAASFGISTTAAVAVVLLLRLRQIAGALVVGVVLLARRHRKSIARRRRDAGPVTTG